MQQHVDWHCWNAPLSLQHRVNQMILSYCLDALRSSKILQWCQKSSSNFACGKINASEDRLHCGLDLGCVRWGCFAVSPFEFLSPRGTQGWAKLGHALEPSGVVWLMSGFLVPRKRKLKEQRGIMLSPLLHRRKLDVLWPAFESWIVQVFITCRCREEITTSSTW